MKKMLSLFALLPVLLLAVCCVPACAENAGDDPVRALMDQMSLEEKVGQLFIIRVDALDPDQQPSQINDAWAVGNTALTDAMKETLAKYPAGGVALSGKNLYDQKQILSFVKDLKSASPIQLFIALDEEGGLVARLANTPSLNLPRFESAGAVGAGGNPGDAENMGKTIAAYLRLYGITMNFAPVADVNTNPDNPVIGSRAFSHDARTVALMSRAFADQLQQKGVIPVFKHFPGHGDTAEDSHTGLAVSYKTREEMVSCEWLPYQTLTQRDCVMTAHIATPNVTHDMIPATMSPLILQGVLRDELGFTGVIMTDSMDMGAITQLYQPGEAAVGAILAGCDIVLGPEVYADAFNAVLDAVKTGDISRERLDQSVYRILSLKAAYGMLD